ncbi:MAG: hypothetical protein DIU71_12340 [Proteobacteria bacterium]|nr:MAG: hypothetical protein DIU71_12340 [Pseudomonadota bacterium]
MSRSSPYPAPRAATRNLVLALLALSALVLLVVAAPFPGGTLWLQAVHDSAHGPVFAAIAVICRLAGRELRGARGAVGRQYALALLASAILGAATELLQLTTARDASLGDFGNDVLGAVAGLGACAVFDRDLRAPHRWLAAAVALVAWVAWAAPLGVVARAYAARHADFPALGDFSGRLDPYFIWPQWAAVERVPLPATWARAPGEHATRVRFQDGPWPGLEFREPVPDWRGHAALALDVTNPADATLELHVRVHDAAHDHAHEDRFNRALSVPPRTRSVLRIPLEDIERGPSGRRLDMSRIAGLIVFRGPGSDVPEMYVAKVWLERAHAAPEGYALSSLGE